MKHQLDNLFREKFDQHSLPAPEAAWSRIEKEMPVQRSTFFSWKVAAAFILLAVSIALLIPTDKPTNELAGIITEKSPRKQSLSSQKDAVSDSITSKATVKNKLEVGKKKSETKSKTKKTTPIILNFSKQQDEIAQATIPMQKTEVLSTNDIEEGSEGTTIKNSEIAFRQEVASTTIVIAASEVNQKYLLPVPSSDATSSEKSASSIRKLLEKAEDLKTNATGFGELRQKKNELLALSSDRYRGRNEKNERNN